MTYRPVNAPDPQHAHLDALNEAIDEACTRLEAAGFTRYDIEGCFPQLNEETGQRGYQSVVFTSDDLAGYDYEEAMDVVMAVGSRDLACKIEEAQRTLRNLNELGVGSEEDEEE